MQGLTLNLEFACHWTVTAGQAGCVVLMDRTVIDLGAFEPEGVVVLRTWL